MFNNLKACLGVSVFGVCLHLIFTTSLLGAVQTEDSDLSDLSIEDLMNVKVTSVSKKEEVLADTAAAVYVISGEDIRRSGVTNIPDALRMVPGLQVNRIDSSKWAVSSRGLTGRFSNYLLVLMDGRVLYTPSFSGVYWEVQDTMLDDIDRIEVIRGPGAALWGANAVNGVINIITKAASDSQGGLVNVGGGNLEKNFENARYGFSMGKSAFGRVYVKHFNRGEFQSKSGDDAGDDWDMNQAGFRVDTKLGGANSYTLQGDAYKGNLDQSLTLPVAYPPYQLLVNDEGDVSGGNLMARWQHIFSSSSDFSLQMYYDQTEREEVIEHEKRKSFDLDFQHRFLLGNSQDIVWGSRYHFTHDNFTDAGWVRFDPNSRDDQLYSVFVQDQLKLIDDLLLLTLGTKLEHNDYTGFEIQPSCRLFLDLSSQHKFWTAVSRAVRTPSRIESDGEAPIRYIPSALGTVEFVSSGSSNFQSQDVIAYELGYRYLPTPDFSTDIAAFYNSYDNLSEFELEPVYYNGAYFVQASHLTNELSGDIYGFELASSWQVMKWVKLDFAYTLSFTELESIQSESPRHQVSFRTTITPIKDLEMQFWLRYTDNDITIWYYDPANQWYHIDDYTEFDVNLSYKLTDSLTLSMVGQNLFDDGHVEYVNNLYEAPVEVPRSFYTKLTWSF